jgi:hypothetical protein
MIKPEIRTNTKKIWEYLDKKGEASLQEIKEHLGLGEQEACLALGWMSYDNKIFLHRNGQDLYVVVFDYW